MLSNITVNDSKTGFSQDGKPFFWLADTCWSAFTNIDMTDWEYYIDYRAKQGFNIVQINTLPQGDRCLPDLGIYPYATVDGQVYDWDKPQQAYWERAKQMCRIAVEHGIRPALVLLWVNFVPETWWSPYAPQDTVMPRMHIEQHVRRVIDELGGFNPIYLISGDTDLESEAAISYYTEAASLVRQLSPHALKGLHIMRAYSTIPDKLVELVDFYTFQSGHNEHAQEQAYKLPLDFLKLYPRKPLINAEPCYEQMGYSHRRYGRFDDQDTRAAAWSSILSGASAGVTYGAHGIWNWKKLVSEASPLGEGFDTPQCWYEALHFPGAWDFGFIPRLLESADLHDFSPAKGLVLNDAPSICMGRCGNTYIAYLPCATQLRLDAMLDGYRAFALDLSQKRIADLTVNVSGRETAVEQHPFERDALIFIEPAE